MQGKIFGVGLSRTGTTSLHSFLNACGFTSQHFWRNYFNSEKPSFEDLRKYDCICDSPIPLLYKELDALFPRSRFILTTRNLEGWLKSMEWMFSAGRSKPNWNWSDGIEIYHNKLYGTNSYNEEILRASWTKHHAEINDYFQGRRNDLFILNIDTEIRVNELKKFLGSSGPKYFPCLNRGN